MHIPLSIDQGKKTPQERARARLKYMLQRAALEAFNVASLRGLAAKIDVDHSSMCNAIKRGYFTEPMASKIEKAIGRKHLCAEHLCKPMEIGKNVAEKTLA